MLENSGQSSELSESIAYNQDDIDNLKEKLKQNLIIMREIIFVIIMACSCVASSLDMLKEMRGRRIRDVIIISF